MAAEPLVTPTSSGPPTFDEHEPLRCVLGRQRAADRGRDLRVLSRGEPVSWDRSVTPERISDVCHEDCTPVVVELVLLSLEESGGLAYRC